jgi:hypothetical protein
MEKDHARNPKWREPWQDGCHTDRNGYFRQALSA